MTFVGLISAAALTGYFACSTGSGLVAVTGPSAPAPPLPAGSADVIIQDFEYIPASVSIKVGASVRWTNRGPSPHTTTSTVGAWDSGQLSPQSGPDKSGVVTPGGSFQAAFTKPGTYSYYCKLHPPSLYPAFVGTVVVTP